MWSAVRELFGPRGACGGCWCMVWRSTPSEFQHNKGDGNRDRLRRLVARHPPPGIVGVVGNTPVAWCAVAPRSDYQALARSRVLRPVDAEPVWSITCLFVARGWRRMGISVQMIHAAARFAKRHGARIVEGYPVEPRGRTMPDAFAWTGLRAAFAAAGFEEVARRSPTRPIMRWHGSARGR